MEDIKIYKNIEASAPSMIAGWPGMGSVALGAVDYLKRKLNAINFAEIKVDRLSILDSVIVENGMARFAEPPKNNFYYVKEFDLIIFEGEAQLPGPAGISILNKVLDIASRFKTRRIYTGAAFPMPVSYKSEPEVYVAANNKILKEQFRARGIKTMESGHISGLNGLILGFAKQRGVEAACLLATIPQYAINLPNPKASCAIVRALEGILNFKVSSAEINEYIKDMDDKMAMIEESVKDVFPVEHHEEAPSFTAEKKAPPSIVEKIEKMFDEARSDKSKAVLLKKELDRWDLYKIYEDRFLDLFKENQ